MVVVTIIMLHRNKSYGHYCDQKIDCNSGLLEAGTDPDRQVS